MVRIVPPLQPKDAANRKPSANGNRVGLRRRNQVGLRRRANCLNVPSLMRRLLLLLLAFLAVAPPGHATGLQPVEVAQGVYAFIGALDAPSPENSGDIGNSGFIVGTDGVVVVDTGISYRHGRAMLEAIARITDKPVRLVIITHAVQEFLFGNAAFAERGITLLAHAKSVDLMRSRCRHCLEDLDKLLGAELMAGSRVVLPNRTVDGSTRLTVAGRDLDLLYFGWAATPGGLAVLDRASGVLFAGGLVSWRRIPELRDAKLAGWLSALDRLEAIHARWIVPGHGPVSTSAAIAQTRAYLMALDARVRQVYESGASLLEALDMVDLPQYRDWGMYPTAHRRNAQQRYLELEWEEFDTDPSK
jgi:glyoxylase-like metal-dependent hydrolase (beta-lactamase superfamily II)